MTSFFSKGNHKNSRGFTLIETLVAITILMIAIAGPLTIAHRGLIAAVEAKDQMIASYLAQDAMEYIKNVRDNNIRDGNTANWLNGDISVCKRVGGGNTSKCAVDTMAGNAYGSGFDDCANNIANCLLYITDQGYGHTGGTPSIFTRWAYVDVDNSGVAEFSADVVVTVEWESTTGINSTVLKNQMFEVLR